MLFTKIILSIMAVFSGIAVADKIFFHNRFGYGKEFDLGLCTLGPIVISMAGFLCAVPVLQKCLIPVSTLFSRMTGADPSMFSSTFLAIDMGGLPLALQTAPSPSIAAFTGGLYASIMGASISFIMPFALETLAPSQQPYLAKGMLYGICVIPVTCVIGGIFLGLTPGFILRNVFPVLLLSALLILGLTHFPELLLAGFQSFSQFIRALAHIFLFCAIFYDLTGYALLPGIYTVSSQISVIGTISITLAGAYPFIKFLTVVFQKNFSYLAEKLHLTDTCIPALLICTSNCIPTIEKLSEMPPKEKILCVAFMVQAAFIFGDHLAYLSVTIPEYLPAILFAKLAGGFIAVFFACFMESRQK